MAILSLVMFDVDLLSEYQRFRARLSLLKDQNRDPEWDWYPYQSLENIPKIVALLHAAGMTLGEILEPAAERSVLDIGCADGDLSFLLEHLGGTVDAVDYGPTNYNGLRGISCMKTALGSAVSVFETDLDAGFKVPRPRYALSFALGLLYHLKNPFHFLESIAGHADYCFLSTRVARNFPGVKPSLEQAPVAYLLDPGECNNDKTNYWIFSDAGLRRILDRSGWHIRALIYPETVKKSDPITPAGDERAFTLLQSKRLKLWRGVDLREGWHHLEPEGFRWTERTFTLVPAKGGVLRLDLYLPESILALGGAVFIQSLQNGRETFVAKLAVAGMHLVVKEVVKGQPVTFSTSAALPPDSVDSRERGIVVSSVDVW